MASRRSPVRARYGPQKGGVREWLNRAVSKTAMVEKPSKVRILPPPQNEIIYMFNLGKQEQKKIQPTTKDLVKQIKELEKQIQQLTKEVHGFQKDMQKAVTKVGIVRFNPFGEIGGDQSFSVALLDQNNSGIVITSHYGREFQRVYAKPIQHGKSDNMLSKEEEQVIIQAMNLGNAKLKEQSPK
jgi:DNA gyrase/topoisomerase IV subunit A